MFVETLILGEQTKIENVNYQFFAFSFQVASFSQKVKNVGNLFLIFRIPYH